MYLTLIFLPLFGAAIAGLFGRKCGITGSQLITTSCLCISAIMAIFAFFEVGLCQSYLSIQISS